MPSWPWSPLTSNDARPVGRIPIDENRHFRAKRVMDLDQLERYRFCGHGVIRGKAQRAWQDVDYVLRCFAKRTTAVKVRDLDHVRQ